MYLQTQPIAITTPRTHIPTDSRHLRDLPDAGREEFDPDAVSDHDRLAGQLCVLAYALQVDAQHTLRTAGRWSDVIVCTSKLGAQAICGVRDGEAWIAFRGTKQLIDVAIDVLAVPVHSQHLGFGLAWRSLAGEITDWLRRVHPEAVHLTGHSLGGSMALVAALDLAHKDSPSTPYPVGSVVTFAAPRAFRLKATSAYASATSRVHDNDRSLSQVTTCYEHQRDVIRLLTHGVGYKGVGSSITLPDTKQHVARFTKRATPLLQFIGFAGIGGWAVGSMISGVSAAIEVMRDFVTGIFVCMVFFLVVCLIAQSAGSHACARYVAMIGAKPLQLHRSPNRVLPAIKARLGMLVALAVVAYVSGVGRWFGSVATPMTLRSMLPITAVLICGLLGTFICGWFTTAWSRRDR